ncbi:MAG: ATP-binding protein [Planctomycetota bacterium]
MARLRRALKANPVVALLGPRQCGKSTLARMFAAGVKSEYFDLEHPADARRLAEPMTALEPLRGLVVLDEVQHQPELFPVLRVLADRKPSGARFLLLGSASPDLIQRSSESLAGRIAFLELGGFDLEEATPPALRRLWVRGGFPRSFLARSEAESFTWRESFMRTFLERDIRQFGVQVPPPVLRRLWTMVAHYHGQIWNSSEVAGSLGEAHTTVKRHLDILTEALMTRQLQPWFANLGKRQVKAPKVYVRDSGLLHALLGIPSFAVLEGHPKLGASFEGFVVEQAANLVGERNLYFWATQAGAELDLLISWKTKRHGIEIKYSDAPRVTKSMEIAMRDLGLDRLWVVYPGQRSFPLRKRIELVAAQELRETLVQAGLGSRER